ncbi:DNA polymerase III subunit delta' [Vibrio brasiliensis]|uniref:DNA polymerase III subunit delta' n=1 Tax=Vibrio brasiliensis TaxID=170652 RepID=UPI001EFCF504|nr:DNA polymerase III subunit delta' [Vibrio brasiliensis]MCG9647186.1 DNA polymerase III subunit delta' [Vibrio brasiliensis]
MNDLYPWLTDLWQEWQASLQADRFPNASLVVASQGMGVEQLVDNFSRAVMCQNYPAESCGFCHSCQLMESNSHPDFHVIRPEKEGKTITVEQIRQCNRLAQESSQLSGSRLFVIYPVEAMNESAANALLKTLEEPSASCLFLLVTHRSHSLLPTITSRCQQWHLTAPESQSVATWLSAQSVGDVPAYAAHINGNAPLATLEFVKQDKVSRYLELESQFIALCQQQGDVAKLAKELASQPDESLNWLWYLLSDGQKVHYGLQTPAFTPGAAQVAELVDYQRLYSQAQELLKLIEQLRLHSGLNAELLILDWLFKFNGEICS